MLKLMTFNFNVRFTLSVSLVNLFSVNQGARGMPWIMYLLWVFHHLWDEVCHMPVGGVWWLNVDRYARCRQPV
ncbi:cellulose biosynthesis protein BcsE [Klebsiella pneumoniae subsp. pneumoniae]|nr:cellulose biosynthesis protein BcsE [Klebsiella pneumoniae subsp. pneumoniae]